MATPDPYLLYVPIRARLAVITGLGGNIYDGFVPTTIPKDSSGFIRPYVVIFAGTGTDLPAERDSTGLVDMDVLDWPFQTTVAAADALSCMRLAHDVRLALTNLPVQAGFVKPDGYSATGGDRPLLDNQVTPARFYMPLMWRLTTT
jgi:hypothetical protein